MQKRWKQVGTAVAVLAAVAAGYVARGQEAAPSESGATRTAGGGVPVASAAGAGLPDFSGIVERYGPAVVNVSTTGVMNEGGGAGPGSMDPDDPLSQFFRHFGFGTPQQQGPMILRGLGSGFIVDPSGIVLTNAHVVDGAKEVKVKLTDKREFAAKVVGVDKASDVAVLRIAAKNLPAVKIGNPGRLRVGSWVLAIGSPFGFENSATAGIVSARSRSLPNGGYVPFLQTDVAVNPGNSGGPLFDADGEVVGVNSQIYSQSGGYMGLSFAIPIDVAMNVEQQLVQHGKVVRGQLGVTIQDVNQPLAQSFGLSKATGALVSSVQEGGPASKAGIEPGDVLLQLNGQEIASSTELPPRVAQLKPGSEAHLQVWRDHARRDVNIRVGEAAPEQVASATGPPERGGKLGLLVRPLRPDERNAAHAKGGVEVEAVNGPAARAGIQAGDVVLAVNGKPVRGPDELRSMVEKAGKHVALLVERGDARIFVPIDLG